MSSDYYVPGPKRSERVRTLFSHIAARYDLINDIQSLGLHRLWKRRVVKKAALSPSHSALDVCCGTGDIALRMAAHGVAAVGCDFTPEMLAKARERNSAITWVQADALHLPFADASFNAVTIGYGLRNLADFEAGVSELVRVLKPGGRLLILDFGKPVNPLLRFVYFAYLRLVVPLFGLIFCRDAAAYSYILESLQKYPAQDGVTALLKAAACDRVQVENFLGGMMSLHIAEKSQSLRKGHDIPLETIHLVR